MQSSCCKIIPVLAALVALIGGPCHGSLLDYFHADTEFFDARRSADEVDMLEPARLSADGLTASVSYDFENFIRTRRGGELTRNVNGDSVGCAFAGRIPKADVSFAAAMSQGHGTAHWVENSGEADLRAGFHRCALAVSHKFEGGHLAGVSFGKSTADISGTETFISDALPEFGSLSAAQIDYDHSYLTAGYEYAHGGTTVGIARTDNDADMQMELVSDHTFILPLDAKGHAYRTRASHEFASGLTVGAYCEWGTHHGDNTAEFDPESTVDIRYRGGRVSADSRNRRLGVQARKQISNRSVLTGGYERSSWEVRAKSYHLGVDTLDVGSGWGEVSSIAFDAFGKAAIDTLFLKLERVKSKRWKNELVYQRVFAEGNGYIDYYYRTWIFGGESLPRQKSRQFFDIGARNGHVVSFAAEYMGDDWKAKFELCQVIPAKDRSGDSTPADPTAPPGPDTKSLGGTGVSVTVTHQF